MSTDLYGVRVLELAPRERRVRLRVFVVYYDTSYSSHQPLPDDASFFFRYLCETSDRRFDKGGPLGDVVTLEQWLDEPFVDANAWRFVEKLERIATRNFPVEDWSKYQDFYYERGGRWQDEDMLVQADYDVWVTDARWTEQLTLGDSSGTTSYPTEADRICPDDGPHIPDLRNPTITKEPFAGQEKEAGTPSAVAYSDDGRFLAVASDARELVIYDVAMKFGEHARVKPEQRGLFGEIGWLAGTHVLVHMRDGEPTMAYDADAMALVARPSGRTGRAWSRTHRLLAYGEDDTVTLDDKPPIEVGFCAEAIAFTHDETRLYAAGMSDTILQIDPTTATVARTFSAGVGRISSLATNRDGSYVVFLEQGAPRAKILRVADGQVIATAKLPNAPFPSQLAWSPDETQLALVVVTGDMGYGGELRVFPVGLPVLAMKAPASSPVVPPSSNIHAELVRELARASAPFTSDEWRDLLAAHALWLDTGGGGGDGGLPENYYESPWQTLEAAGIIFAVWQGAAGSDGTQAVLAGRRLDGATLAGARLAWADLSGIYGEQLDGARADLRGVTATDGHLVRASFRDADLRMADFSRTNLAGADFTNANLEGCDFDRADLTSANFTGARIGGIKLANARLADIRGFGTLG